MLDLFYIDIGHYRLMSYEGSGISCVPIDVTLLAVFVFGKSYEAKSGTKLFHSRDAMPIRNLQVQKRAA
jgi:hypothetical protein